MAGKITALLLAALIAVPLCCCVADAASEAPAKEAQACCHKEKAAPDAVPEAPDPCDCGEDSKDQWVLAGETKPSPPQWTLLAQLSWEHAPEISVVPGFDSRRAIDIPEAVRLPGKVLSQVHCRYLL